MKRLIAILCLAAGAAGAEGCPDAPDHSAELQALFAKARTAATEAEARTYTNRMWELWADAPDEPAQAVLDRGLQKRASYDLLGALEEFDRLVDYCPDYAEGYNQRAFANFLRQDFEAALVDLDRALVLSPHHVAAKSGRALTLLALGDVDQAREELNAALALNPWLPERHMAAPGAPLAPEGDDI